MMSNQRSVLERYIGSAPVGGVGHGALLPLWLAIGKFLVSTGWTTYFCLSPSKIVYNIVPYNDVRCRYLLSSNLFILL